MAKVKNSSSKGNFPQKKQEVVDLTDEIAIMIETMEQIKFKNLSWLKKYNINLYKKISKLSKKIEKSKLKEKFTVELSQDGNLNLLNKTNNKFMFRSNVFDFGDKIALNMKQDKYKKLVFDGVGLGTQITSIIRMHKPKKAIICEKNLQIFHCSLYITDYEELNKISTLEFYVDKKYNLTKEKNIITLKKLLK